jgi:hypothetical protein
LIKIPLSNGTNIKCSSPSKLCRRQTKSRDKEEEEEEEEGEKEEEKDFLGAFLLICKKGQLVSSCL